MKLVVNKFDLLNLGKIAAIEIFCVLKDIKPISRLNVGETNLTKLSNILKKLNLCTEKSDYRFIPSIDDKGNFNVGVTQKTKQKKGDYFIYISKNKELIKKIKQLENNLKSGNDHKEIAKLLGYPKCCTDFYVNYRAEAVNKRKDDYTLISLKKSKSYVFDYQLNNVLRYFDIGLITFFPCSYQCKEALKMSKKIFEEIKKNSSEYANYLTKRLKCAIIYTDNDGIHVLKDFNFEKGIINYGKVESTCENKLNKQLSSSNKIKIVNKNFIKIMNNETLIKVLKKNAGILIFK